MNLIERLLLRMGQWKGIAALLVVTLPLMALLGLGSLWLTQQNQWLPFLAACFVLAAVAAVFAWAQAWQQTGVARPETPTIDRNHVAADRSWTEAETHAFKEACIRIEDATCAPVIMDALPELIQQELTEIARELRGPKADIWDFSVPEGLLLTSRVTEQFRGHLIDHVPFSDQLTVRQLRKGRDYYDVTFNLWLWGTRAYRGGRLVLNPIGGIMAEARNLLTGRLVATLGSAGVASLQALLLEEVARNAVDLYSGRLALTEAELANRAARTASARGDVDAPPLAPPAIVVMGQVSSGKTALIDALLGEKVGLSGAEPITDSFLRHDWTVDGMTCHLIDTPGLGQSKTTDDDLATWVASADMLLWVVAANRPARAPDRAFLQGITASFAERPDLLQPQIVVVATHVDRFAGTTRWPFPEHSLPPEFLDMLDRLKAQVQADLNSSAAFVPVVTSGTVGSDWNIEELRGLIYAAIDHAVHTQRNRARFAKDGLERDIARNVARFMRLSARSVSMVGGRSMSRVWRRLLQGSVGK